MKVLLDANLLYPTVLREILMGTAKSGLFTPLWSPRILDEWARAAARLGPDGAAIAQGEIARLGANWPAASIRPRPRDLTRLWLPDPDDVHVLAAAIAGSADLILTLNARDFPRHILADEGIARADPDHFLLGLWQASPGPVGQAVANVHAEACRLSGQALDLRKLLKRARLPRLGKAMTGQSVSRQP